MHVLEPKTLRWTREEYMRLADLGFFTGKRVERVQGEVIEMSPQDPEHTTAVSLLDYLLKGVFGEGFVVRVQSPLVLGGDSDPEPDLAVVAGRPRDFASSQPSTALLVVEVAGSSLEYDRTTKAGLYAEAGIPDYWIVDLAGRRLEVHRKPRREPGARFGFGYGDRTILAPSERVSPLERPGASIAVEEMLP